MIIYSADHSLKHSPSLRIQHIFEDGYEGGLGVNIPEILMLLKFCCGSLGYNCFAVFSMPRREFHTLPNNKTPVGCLFGKMNHVTYRVMMPFPFLSLNSTTPGVSTLAQIMCTQRETLRASCFSDVLLGLMHTKSVAGKH